MSEVIRVKANETNAGKRRVWFDLRNATDGIVAETGEAGGQPQISTNGTAWTNTGIGTLTAIGLGRYYADVEQGSVLSAGDFIKTRFKSGNTAETPGDWLIVISGDPYVDNVTETAAEVVALLSTATGLIVAPSGENTMTFAEALIFSNRALSNSAGGSYDDDDVREAIRTVTAQFVRISKMNNTIKTVALTQADPTVDLSTLAGFRRERVTLAERTDFTRIELFDYTEVARELSQSTAEGEPLKISFPTETTAYVYPVPEASQSIRLHYWFPVNEFTSDDDIIQIPITYLREALWWGVPAYMEYMKKQDVLAEPKWQKFILYANSMKNELQKQDQVTDKDFYL